MKFRGDFYFLSNMYPCTIATHCYEFKCVESAFQACKDPESVKLFVPLDGFAAKKLGRKIKLRADWNEVKDTYMYALLKRKFTQHPELLAKLKAVTDPIVEDNDWGDCYWGVCKGKGLNKLGLMLMQLRAEL